jgi:hypothetical protein
MKVCFKIEFKSWEIVLNNVLLICILPSAGVRLWGSTGAKWQERLIVLVHVNQPHDGP